MSSSLNTSAILSAIASLETQLASLKLQLGGASSAKSAPVAKKERKPRKKSEAGPTAWIVFTDRVRKILKDNGYKASAIGVECVQFCSTLKTENADLPSWTDADILARREAWSVPEISKQAAAGKNKKSSAPSSVVSGGDGDGEAAPASTEKPKKERKNPWAGLTAEQKAAKVAAMKAGRSAKKSAASSSDVESVSQESVVAPLPPLPSSPKSVAVSNAAANAAPSAPLPGFKKATLGSKAYWINPESGHTYFRNPDDSRGDWAGLFSKTPKPHIDDSVAEPDFFSLLDEA